MNRPERTLKVAQCVEEMADAFDAMALSTREDMERFYVETMEARTGNEDKSPIHALERACCRPAERGAMLLMGHRGCGKSTELNDMKLRLEREGRKVVIIHCADRLPLEQQPRFSDLLILMGEALYNLANELDVDIEQDTLQRIRDFWTPVVATREKSSRADIGLSAGAEAGTSKLVTILSLWARITSDLKFSEEVRYKSEERIKQDYKSWRTILRTLSDAITEKLGTQPVLFFEELDHLENLEVARNLFFSHAFMLTDVSFPVIYTFPIALHYDRGFAPFEHLFQCIEVFPMLKLETVDGEPYEKSTALLRDIVKKRARDGLIAEEALELMIAKTGGSLRDLFRAIREAAEMAAYRGDRTGNREQTLTLRDAEAALQEIQNTLTRRIEGDEHRFLAGICLGERREIADRDKLLEMLQARAVLEYNAEKWYNVHPLVADYLEKLNYIRREDGRWVAGEKMR